MILSQNQKFFKQYLQKTISQITKPVCIEYLKQIHEEFLDIVLDDFIFKRRVNEVIQRYKYIKFTDKQAEIQHSWVMRILEQAKNWEYFQVAQQALSQQFEQKTLIQTKTISPVSKQQSPVTKPRLSKSVGFDLDSMKKTITMGKSNAQLLISFGTQIDSYADLFNKSSYTISFNESELKKKEKKRAALMKVIDEYNENELLLSQTLVEEESEETNGIHFLCQPLKVAESIYIPK
ncbi:Hypothetical_protein [Hexamita inflata]|uniref:Hypothetical_protein n=1 Tax=Hexamita inflata TaxID=28002 RepID=A0AA86UC74_9EUKA|nr:Hypothetical protein HINF_LOCUS24048 [Hexamita inflata]